MNHVNLLPRHYHVNRKWKNRFRKIYNKYNQEPIYDNVDFIISSMYKETKNIQEILNEIMYDLEPEERRLFNYYYDIETMNKKNTMSEIAQLMCYSKQTCQQKMKHLKNKMKVLYNDYI